MSISESISDICVCNVLKKNHNGIYHLFQPAFFGNLNTEVNLYKPVEIDKKIKKIDYKDINWDDKCRFCGHIRKNHQIVNHFFYSSIDEKYDDDNIKWEKYNMLLNTNTVIENKKYEKENTICSIL
jgi:hypothetical protein